MPPMTGDIKALYAEQRLSDHASTSISLKESALVDDVWFEGHMDWSFRLCNFKGSFYYGVEGERLEGDPREDEEFPPYGTNGLNFDGCTFDKYFEIAENCVAVFVECTFNKNFKISKGSRAEFIECTVVQDIEFEEYCEVRFRRCEFPSYERKVTGSTGCTFEFNDCIYTSYTEYFLSITGDCTANLINADETPIVTSSKELFIVDDNSFLNLFKFGSLLSDTSAISCTDSKIKARNITLINGADNVVKGTGSEVFFKDVIVTTSDDTTFDLTDSTLRVTGATSIIGEVSVIKAVNSTVGIDNFDTISSSSSHCIDADSTSFNVNNGTLLETSGGGAGILATGTSKSVFSSITEIKGATAAAEAGTGATIAFDTVDLLQGIEDDALVLSGGTITTNNVVRIEGKQNGITGTGGFLRVANTTDSIYGESGNAVDLTEVVYELQNINDIYSPTGSAIALTDGQGVVLDVAKIYSDSGVTISGTMGDYASFVATGIGEISSQSNGIIDIQGSGTKDSLVKFQDIGTFSTENAPENAIRITGVYRIELVTVAEIVIDTVIRYAVYLSSIAPGYGVIKVLDCAKLEATLCRAGFFIRDSLIADVVGIDAPGSILIEESIIGAFAALNTNLLLKNYAEISVQSGDARGVYLYNLGMPGCVMDVVDVDLIKVDQGRAVESASTGHVTFTDVARFESQGDLETFFATGEGTFTLQGGNRTTELSAKDNETVALRIEGQPGAKPADVTLAKVQVVQGQTVLNTIEGTARGVNFRDVNATATGLRFYGSGINIDDMFETLDSALYFFDSNIGGPGQGGCTNSALTFENSEVSCSGTAFTGMNSSAILGNNSQFNCTQITGFQSASFNSCKGRADFDCQGVVMNGCNFTGEIFSSGYSARAGLLINGSYVAEINATQNTAVLLNGTHSIEDLTVGDNNAIFLNWSYFSKDTTLGDGNSMVSNYGVLRNVTGDKGNVFVANRTTMNKVVFDKTNAVILNYCTPTSEGVNVGSDSYLEMNNVVNPNMPVTLDENCAFVSNTCSVESLTVPASSAALLTNFYTPEITIEGDTICAGGELREYTGGGRMIATQRVATNNSCLPQDVSTGILVRGEGAGAQTLIWSEKTALQMGDGFARLDARMYALEGVARVVAPTALLHGPNSGDAYCQVQGKQALREAPQGGVTDLASGEVTRQAGTNVVDTAGQNILRTATDSIIDEATRDAIRNAQMVEDNAEVDITRLAGANLIDTATGDATRTAGNSLVDVATGGSHSRTASGTISDTAGSISHTPPI